MRYEILENYLSEPRLNKYLIACNNSKVRAKKLYRANIRISQSFYPILNLFETFLRNSMSNQIAIHFNDDDWIINQQQGFMSAPTLKRSNFWFRRQIQKVIQNTRPPVTSGKVISEQSFGMWTVLFEPIYYQLIGGSVIHSFPNKPVSMNRSDILNRLNRIRKFRNRIYHNEAICFKAGQIDFTKAKQIKKDIYELLNWMDNDIAHYVKQFDNIDNKIQKAQSI